MLWMLEHLSFGAGNLVRMGLLGLASVGFAGVVGAKEPPPPVGDEAFKIVSPQWLAEHANDPKVRILDVRTDVHDYLAGHVPNATHIADSTMRAPKAGVPVQYLEPEQMAELFCRAGIHNTDSVVLYSSGKDVLGATMVAYCLQRLGYNKTMVLDGGYPVYANDQKATQDYPDCPRGDLTPKLDRSCFANLDDVLVATKNSRAVLIDARPANAYAGAIDTWMRNGHIPGAVNLDWHEMVDPNNNHQFKPVDEMRGLVERTGVKKENDVIIYCGTSREATLLYMVMKHVLGYPKVRLYEGSWTEYCAHKELPVAKGPEPGGTRH